MLPACLWIFQCPVAFCSWEKQSVLYDPKQKFYCTPLRSPASVDSPGHLNMNEWGNGRPAGFPQVRTIDWPLQHCWPLAPLSDLPYLSPDLWDPEPHLTSLWVLSPLGLQLEELEGWWGQTVSIKSSLRIETVHLLGVFLSPPKEEEGEARGLGKEKKKGSRTELGGFLSEGKVELPRMVIFEERCV